MNNLEEFFECHQNEEAFAGIEKQYRKSLKRLEAKTWHQIEGIQGIINGEPDDVGRVRGILMTERAKRGGEQPYKDEA
ncbi:hypothetical protein [Lacticaseibacillus paracasei]|jgi:hypothetical protein|uniref:Uncharacterized protein n=1 Tax=Lacticaseibacillus paracasei TaxID=1597 RepID=A0A422LWZ2_LACPA|nr:hypothetical protein [Lacticaseibacillus paracasei]MDE3289490.1 hypothetical protein [Lacticaseibacillus paracasei]RND57007.1 hypothetical protein FAM18123_03139 [Lacticaseibacillus paracasei]RND78624.1 hypothetical protein FAM18157_02833 [Lacticaseibacillus paracasei]RND81304.1 hypothetical protein FAM18172_02975 [Lacticaseibacillus paracasei]